MDLPLFVLPPLTAPLRKWLQTLELIPASAMLVLHGPWFPSGVDPKEGLRLLGTLWVVREVVLFTDRRECLCDVQDQYQDTGADPEDAVFFARLADELPLFRALCAQRVASCVVERAHRQMLFSAADLSDLPATTVNGWRGTPVPQAASGTWEIQPLEPTNREAHASPSPTPLPRKTLHG